MCNSVLQKKGLRQGQGTTYEITGIVRPIDSLGRIVLPKEIRNVFDIGPKDPLEIYIDTDKIILKKYAPSCIFCEDSDNVAYYKGKLICSACLESLKNITI